MRVETTTAARETSTSGVSAIARCPQVKIAFRRLKIKIPLVYFLQGGELSESGSLDELSTGHFHMPYDIVREGMGETVFI